MWVATPMFRHGIGRHVLLGRGFLRAAGVAAGRRQINAGGRAGRTRRAAGPRTA